MRTTGYLGAAFVLAGCLLVLASTGALDVTVAERGMAVDTASDPNAFLGLDYSGTKNVTLDNEDCTTIPFFDDCYHFDEEIVLFEDNANGNLTIPQDPQIVMSGNVSEPLLLDGFSYEQGPPGIGRVVGNFRCPTSGSQQNYALSTVEIDVVATGDNLTVDLTRTIIVECEAGPVP